MKAEWCYNTAEDILLLKIAERQPQYSLVSPDDIFTVDMDGKNRLAGLEIFDASEAVGFGLDERKTRKALESIKAADLNCQLKGDILLVSFRLVSAFAEPIEASVPISVKAKK